MRDYKSSQASGIVGEFLSRLTTRALTANKIIYQIVGESELLDGTVVLHEMASA